MDSDGSAASLLERAKQYTKTRVKPRRPSTRSLLKKRVQLLGVGVLVVWGIVCFGFAVQSLLSFSQEAWAGDISNRLGQWKGSSGEWYPTSGLTRDVIPKPIHSHNDYWRAVPLYTGLSYGCISTEADVWFFKDDLFVGHDRSSLAVNRTLKSLYINPLVEILTKMNPHNEFTANDTLNGVFDTVRQQTLFLYIDVKNAPVPTYYKILEQLELLREPVNYLTTFENDTIVYRPVTVVLTGAAPFDHIIENSTYRYTFYDAPINDLGSNKYTKFTSLTATGNFRDEVGGRLYPFRKGYLTESERTRMREQIEEAHKRDIIVRYWNLPSWPVSWRNGIWREIMREGVDLLNADDLKAAAEGRW